MAKKRIVGKCALCGQLSALTYEHIPPRMAFNSAPARQVSGEALFSDDRKPWDLHGLKYVDRQRGTGRYSLCGTCNNNTGSWYADAYIQFASAVGAFLSSPDLDAAQSVTFRKVYPLRVIKQVLSMFCSINHEHPTSQMDDIRAFVLDKERTNLDTTKYKVSMYFTRSLLGKQLGLTVMGNIQSQSFCVVNEITAAPLGFLLYIDPSSVQGDGCIDITHFPSYGYDDICDISVPIVIKEVNSWVPADFRTKEEIEADTEKNRRAAEKLGF